LNNSEPSAVTDANGHYAIDTTNLSPPGTGPDGVFYPTLDLQVGADGRWLNTTSTLAAYVKPATDATRDFGVAFQPTSGVAPVGAESLANVTTASQQGPLYSDEFNAPVSVASDPNGNYVVAWRTFAAGGTDTIMARVLNADGTAKTDEITVGTSPSMSSYVGMPEVVMAGDGRFAVAWTTSASTSNGTTYSTMTQVYQAD